MPIKLPAIAWLFAVVCPLAALAAPPAVTRTVLYTFSTPDGSSAGAEGAPIVGLDGALYGTTTNGGPANFGSLYRLTPPKSGVGSWTKTDLYDFPMNYGPGKTLVVDATGALYGVSGTVNVFQLAPPLPGGTAWRYRTLFSARRDISELAIDRGALFGSLGRTIFRLAPPYHDQTTWRHSILHTFDTERISPSGVLIRYVDGRLTLFGTGENSVLFSLTEPQAPTTNWTFADLHVAAPFGPMIATRNLVLYGVNYEGVVRLSPPKLGQPGWKRDVLYHLPVAGSPLSFGGGRLVEDATGHLYGSSDSWGFGNCDQNSPQEACSFNLRLTPNGTTLPWNLSQLYSYQPKLIELGYGLLLIQEAAGRLSLYGASDELDTKGRSTNSIYRLQVQY